MVGYVGWTAAVGLVLAAILFLLYYPPFGGRSSAGQKKRYRQSAQFQGKQFRNASPSVPFQANWGNTKSLLRDYMKGNPNVKPAVPLPVRRLDPDVWRKHASSITWFGHSALLLRVEGVTLLVDPMFGPAASPFAWIGSKRYSKELPAEVEELPQVDAVLFTHDHYDHLDYSTVRKLKDRVGRFIVPLGVAAHLERWGVRPELITEHDWWEELEFQGLRLVCTPARHFSGRGLFDRGRSLWCSWVIQGSAVKLFCSGDSGYGSHFAEIGRKYGPFDAAMMECGQYDPRWADIHMLPEETVRAHREVQGGILVPIHWGAFTLALHDWVDPAERVTKAAGEAGVPAATPEIGETIPVGTGVYPATAWWRGIR
ncbi:MBL fold metallo-hydrolase [Paenibacillus gansuensis]|uniref:MBL fold metallo-hydrolase n=1 Tax=Paenibacillus gansuensis TaxID=306542 RepID=A0ABW5PGB1_9BACL